MTKGSTPDDGMRMHRRFIGALVFGGLVATTAGAEAQPLGTFRWNFAPYCNVVTVLVEQKGAVFELTGTGRRLQWGRI